MNRSTYRRLRLAKFVLLDVLFIIAVFAIGTGIGWAFGYVYSLINPL